MPKIRVVHLDVDFEAIPKDARVIVVERYGGKRTESMLFQSGRLDLSTWSLFGRDLSQGDIFRFVGVAGSGKSEVGGMVLAPVERWVLKRVEP